MTWRSALLLYLVLASAISFGWIGSTDVYVMEGIVADGAREMVASDEWAVPRLHGEIYMYKPPLAYWLASLPARIWDRQAEWTLRAPFALCTVLLGLAVLGLTRRALGPRRALICALATLTGVLVVQKLHRAEFDMPLALGVGVAILAAGRNLAAERPEGRLWWICYLGLSVGFLAKGGPALMLFAPGLLLAAVVTGRVRLLLRPAHLAAVALFLLLAGAWVYGVVATEGWRAFDQPLLEARHKGFSDWTWNAFGVALTKPFFVVGLFLPWSLTLPIVVRQRWWRLLAVEERQLALTATAFLVAGVLALTVVPTTESRYFLPLAAPAGVLFGMAAAGGRSGERLRVVDSLLWALGCGAGLALLAAALGPWQTGPAMRVLAAALGAGTAAVALRFRKRRAGGGRAVLLLAIALCHWIVHTAILEPARVEKRSLRPVAEAFRPLLEASETLWTTPVSSGFHHSGLFFYLGHPVRTVSRDSIPVRGSALVLFNDEPVGQPDYVLPVEHEVVERRRKGGVEFVLARVTGGPPRAPQALSPAGIRAVMRRAADWQLAHPRHPRRDWTNAVLWAGLLAAYRATAEESYLEHLLDVGEAERWQPGRRERHADDHAIAQTYLDLARITGESRMAVPFRQVVERMMASPPQWRQEHQTIDYWWSDALFMSPPALAKLAALTGEASYLEFMDRLWRQAHRLLYDRKERLFHRDARQIGDAGSSFWARGNGWVLAGIARVLEELPAGHRGRELYLSVYREMAERVADLQPADGLWRADLMASPLAAPGETSGTALFCYAMAWGINHRLLDRQRYLPVVRRSWAALNRLVDEEGRLGWVQAPGVRPDHVRASDWEVYGTGAFLLAGEEVLALVGGRRAAPAERPDSTEPMPDDRQRRKGAARSSARLGALVSAVALASAVAPSPVRAELTVEEQVEVAPVWSGHPVGFAIDTAGERQYVAFYDEERWMTVAARDVGSTDWSFKRLPSRLAWDSHSEVVLAADSAGYVHVAGNMHGDPLVYFRSRRPHDISTLEPSSMLGSEERRVTYPRFVRDARGALFFHYRDGKSGRGVRIFNRWDLPELRWRRYLDRPLFDGLGRASAYLTGPLPGPDGRFHLVWVWRDTPSGATNHDISYARSSDLAHWETAGGVPLQLPMTPEDSAAIVDPVPVGGGLAGIAFHVGWDGEGRPVVNYVKYGPKGASQLHNARWEGDRWRIYRTTDWSWRWELDITGSLQHSIVTEAVRLDAEGRLRQRFRHLEAGAGDWILDPESLRPVETRPPPETLVRLRRPESPVPGMEVRQFTWDRQGRYMLRWETLPHNRDRRRRGPKPEPTMLRVLRLGENE